MKPTTLFLATLLLAAALLVTPQRSHPALLTAQTHMAPPPGLIVLPPEAPGSIAFEAEQLRQMLTVRLVNRGMYRVVSHLALEATLRARTLSPGDLTDPETLTAVAAELDADYLLASSLSSRGDQGSWSITMTNAYTGATVWSTILPVTTTRPMTAVRTATDQLDVFGRDVRMVQLADIELLLQSGEVTRAATLFSRYRETNPLTAEARELGERIGAQQALQHFDTAQRFTELWLFDEAYIAINRALALRPDNQKFALYINRIRAAETAAAAADLDQRIAVIQRLLDDGYPESAVLLLDAIAPEETDDPADPRIAELRHRIDESIGARRRYDAALAAYWAGEYDRARAHVTEAIRRVPARGEYGELLTRIDRAAGDRRQSDMTWEGYRNRLAQRSVIDMLRGPVRISPAWEINLGSGGYTWRDRDTLNTTEIDQLILGGRWMRPYLLMWGQSSPLVSLYAGWHAGATLRLGVKETDADSGAGDGSRRVGRDTLWALGPAGGGFLQARLFAFSLTGGMELDNHLFILRQLQRDPATDTDRTTTSPAWIPSLNWFAAVSWHWDNHNRITLRYTASLISRVVPPVDTATERYRPHSLTLGYARSTR
ncbi:MAG: hypothetical protein PF508_03100 [Spirochaeta sp.]|nr:hypothetical protein [Spirochaeta sp.]